MEANLCQHNKFGYCKFGSKCRNIHIDTVCDRNDCDMEKCTSRHPRPCFYFMQYGRCKFFPCSYSHEMKQKKENFRNIRNRDYEIQTTIGHFKELIAKFEILIEQFSVKAKQDVEIDEVKIKEINAFKCDKCNFSSNRENGLQIHSLRKHGGIKPEDDIETEFDLEIEEYLSSGILGTDPQLWEDLLWYLSSNFLR